MEGSSPTVLEIFTVRPSAAEVRRRANPDVGRFMNYHRLRPGVSGTKRCSILLAKMMVRIPWARCGAMRLAICMEPRPKGGKNGSKIGTVYKLKPPVVSGEDWSFIVLHDFRGALIGDGANPFSELILLNGAFYGTTSAGGETYKTKSGAVFTGGSVFSLVP
jgi:hypothetical protein